MDRRTLVLIGIVELLIAAMLVGVAITLDGDAGRITNGVGGALWFGAAVILLIATLRTRPARKLWPIFALLVIAVAFVITPSALVLALIGFVPAGFVMARVAGRHELLWAAMIPAWYLPAHIGTAVAKAAGRAALGMDAPVRTDPPPTGAIVPAVMVLAALAGGYIALRLRAR